MKFTVRATVTISVFKEVEAATAEEARDIADGLYVPGLCHQCEGAGERESDSWELSGGLDGCASDIEVES